MPTIFWISIALIAFVLGWQFGMFAGLIVFVKTFQKLLDKLENLLRELVS